VIPYRFSKTFFRKMQLVCPNMRKLDLSGCPRLTNAALTMVAQVYPALESLNITGCVKVSTLGLKALGKCSMLRCLVADRCERITSNSMYVFATVKEGKKKRRLSFANRKLPRVNRQLSLREISLVGCYRIAPQRFGDIALSCKLLTNLNFSYCQVDAAALRVVADNLRELAVIGLRSCRVLDNDAILYVCTHCPLLCSLDIRECELITDELLLRVATLPVATTLSALNLGGLPQITDKGWWGGFCVCVCI
jgi:hypothetical protein